MTKDGLQIVGTKGQVVIPKELREQLGIEPGDRMRFWVEGDHFAAARADSGAPLRGRFAGRRLPDDLADERGRERRRDEHR